MHLSVTYAASMTSFILNYTSARVGEEGLLSYRRNIAVFLGKQRAPVMAILQATYFLVVLGRKSPFRRFIGYQYPR